MKVGLALSGGGVKGSYQIGCYYAFKKCHIHFSYFTGTSIGSFNAAMLAANKSKELLKFWQNANVGKILGFDEEYTKKYSSKHDIKFIKMTFDRLFSIAKKRGISISGLQDVLNDFQIEKTIRNNRFGFGLSTFRLNDMKPLDIHLEDIPEGQLDDYIIASCYLPVFKPEKLADGSYFFDGGIYNNCPINMLVEKGYKKIYAVDLKAIGVNKKVPKNIDITYIKPSHKISSILSINPQDVKDNINYGYYDALKVLKHLDGYQYIFKTKSDMFYNYVTRKVDRKTMRKMEVLFNTKDKRKIVIKTLEHFMQGGTYFKIYSPRKMIKYYKKYGNHKDILYDFLRKLIVI